MKAHLCRVCGSQVAAKWQPGPPGAAQLDTGTLLGWDLGHWWLLILLIHPRGAISAQSAPGHLAIISTGANIHPITCK